MTFSCTFGHMLWKMYFLVCFKNCIKLHCSYPPLAVCMSTYLTVHKYLFRILNNSYDILVNFVGFLYLRVNKWNKSPMNKCISIDEKPRYIFLCSDLALFIFRRYWLLADIQRPAQGLPPRLHKPIWALLPLFFYINF